MGQYVVSSDTRHVDRDLVWRFLHDDAYWSVGVPRDIVERAIDGSICFSAFDGDPDRGPSHLQIARDPAVEPAEGRQSRDQIPEGHRVHRSAAKLVSREESVRGVTAQSEL